MKASPVGERIKFVQADPVAFLESTNEHYTTAVIAHCIWYFSSPSALVQLLHALGSRADRICIAEYALTATDPRSVPHLLSALTQASMECRKPASKSNVRTVLSPAAIRQIAGASGLGLTREQTFVPVEGMLDGVWEVGAVMDEAYVEEIDLYVKEERERAVVFAMRDAVRANRDAVKARGESVKTMDVWVSVYKQL